MNVLTLLLESNSQFTLTMLIPPSKKVALREIFSTASAGLQNHMSTPNYTKSPKHSLVTYLKALVSI
jgi:hypothetical protein